MIIINIFVELFFFYIIFRYIIHNMTYILNNIHNNINIMNFQQNIKIFKKMY